MKKIISASLSIGLFAILMSTTLNTALVSHTITLDSSVTVVGSEIQIVLSEVAVIGYIMLLLTNDETGGWQAGMVLSTHNGEILHYFIGDPSDQLLTWSVDDIGGHHYFAGQFLFVEFPEFGIVPDQTFVATLSILSGNYDWIPDTFEDTLDFQTFEPYLDGLTTTPTDSQKGDPVTDPIPTSTSTSTSSSTVTSPSTTVSTSTSSTTTTSLTTNISSTPSTSLTTSTGSDTSFTNSSSTTPVDSSQTTSREDDLTSSDTGPVNLSFFMFAFSFSIILITKFRKNKSE